MEQSEIDRLLNEHNDLMSGGVDVEAMWAEAEKERGGFGLPEDATFADKQVGALERGLLNLGKAIPALWQSGARLIQEQVRQGQFSYEQAQKGDWKDVMAMGLKQANPLGALAPRSWWPDFVKSDYDAYTKKNPLALDDEARWTSKIFNAPAEYIRKQSEDLIARNPYMQAEPVESFKDLITDPSKLMASVLESAPLMVASGVAIAAGAAPVAFALMYGAEGNEAYEEMMDYTGGDKDKATEAFHMYGLSAAAVEMVQLGQFMKMGKSQYRALLNRTAQKIAKGVEKKGGKLLTAEWLKTQGAEALEEMTQGTLQELTAKAVAGKEIEGGLMDFIDRRAIDATVAFAMGLPFGGSAALIDATGGYTKRSDKAIESDKKAMDEAVAYHNENEERGIGFTEEDYAIPDALGRRHAAIESLVSSVFGKKVVWFVPNNKTSPASEFQGWASPTDPGVILLNAHKNTPLKAVAFHESVHQLRMEDPEGYQQLAELVSDGLRSRMYLAQEIQAKFNRVGLDVDNDMIQEEIIADVIGRLAMEDEFLDKVAGTNPSMLAKLGRSLKKGIDRVKKNRKSAKVVRAETESGVKWIDGYIEDMEGLTTKIGEALRRVTEAQQEQEPVVQEKPETVAPGTDEEKWRIGNKPDVEQIRGEGRAIEVIDPTTGELATVNSGQTDAEGNIVRDNAKDLDDEALIEAQQMLSRRIRNQQAAMKRAPKSELAARLYESMTDLEAIRYEIIRRNRAKKKKRTPAPELEGPVQPVEKKEYTTVPTEWHGVKVLLDWGRKGLRAEGDQRIKGRKSFDAKWLNQFEQVPVRLSKKVWDKIKARTDEIWKVRSKKEGDYWLVPKQVMKEVRKELEEKDFEQTPVRPQTPKQEINNTINSMINHKIDPVTIGKVVEEMANEAGIPIKELGERAYQLVYQGRGEKPPTLAPDSVVDVMSALTEISHQKDMDEKTYLDLKKRAVAMLSAEKLKREKRLLSKRDKAKIAKAPTREQIVEELARYLPSIQQQRALAAAESRETGEGLYNLPPDATKAQKTAEELRTEKIGQLAGRRAVKVSMNYAIGKYLYWDAQGRQLKESTVESRRVTLKKFLTHIASYGLTKDSDIQDVTPEHIRSWVKGMVNSGLKSSTINMRVGHIRDMFELLKTDKDIDYSPVDKIESLKARPPKAKRVVNRKEMLKTAGLIPATPMGIRDIAIIKVLFDTGLRVSELLGAEIPVPGALKKYVQGKGGKERMAPFITEDAMGALDLYIHTVRNKMPNAENTAAVFLNSKGEPLTRKAIYNIIQKRFKDAGSKMTPHGLRASFATNQLDSGMDLETLRILMGHANAETTASYIKISMKAKREAIKKHHPRPSIAKKGPLYKSQWREGLGVPGRQHLVKTVHKGWVTKAGDVLPVQIVGDDMETWHHYKERARKSRRWAKDKIRFVSFRATAAFEVYGTPDAVNASSVSTIKQLTAEFAEDGKTNTLLLDFGDGRYAEVEFFRKSQAARAVEQAIAEAQERPKAKPRPSIAKKSQRLISKVGPTGKIQDTADRVAGRKVTGTKIETTEQAMRDKRLRAEEKGSNYGYRQGVLDTKAKINELKGTVKKASELRDLMDKWIRKELPVGVRGKMLTALKSIKNMKSFDRAREKLLKEIERQEHRTEMAKLKRFEKAFKKKYGYRKKAGLKEGGKFRIYPEFSSLFEKIFDRISLKRPKTAEQYEDFEDMLEFAKTERAAAEAEAEARGVEVDSPYVRHEIDRVIEKLQRELGRIPVQDWTPDQIRALHDGMTTLIGAYEWHRSDVKEQMDRAYDKDKFNIIGEIMSNWRKKKPYEDELDVENDKSKWHVKSKIKGLFGRFNYNLQTLTQIISGSIKEGMLFRRLARDMQGSVDDVKLLMFAYQDQFQEMSAEKGIGIEDFGRWSTLARVRGVKLPAKAEAWIKRAFGSDKLPYVNREEAMTLPIKLESGLTMNLSVAEALDILMHLRNEHNYTALKKSGIVRRRDLSKDTYRTFKVTDADFAAIREAVPEKALKLIEIFDTLIRENQADVNGVSQVIDGFDIANVEGYWHIRRLLPSGVRGKKASHTYETIESRRAWKHRTGGTHPVVIGDAFNNLIESLETGAEYAGMAESMRLARRITSDKTITNKVRERGYGLYWKDIIKQIDRLQEKQNNMEWFEQMYGGWARSVTRAVFGINLRVSAQQYASVFLAASEFGFKGLSNIRMRPDKELEGRINRWSPMLRERFLGAISREVGDTAKIGGVMRFLTGKDQLINSPMYFVRLFDRMAIMDVWRMAEAEVVAEYQKRYPGVTKEQLIADAESGSVDQSERKYMYFEYDVRVRAEDVVRTTQPTWDVVDRSIIGSTRNPLVKAMTMFHSQREKLVQMLGIANSRMMNDLEDTRRRMKLDTLKEAAQTDEGQRAIGRAVRSYAIVLTNTAMVKAWAVAYGIALLDRDDDIYDWGFAVAADIPGMFYFGDIARDVVVGWGKKMRGKRVYQLGAYEQPPYRVLSSARAAAYEMGNLVMMTTGMQDATSGDVKKQLTRTLDKTWEAAQYGTGAPFLHLTQIIEKLGPKESGGTAYKSYKTRK
jgi:integrase/recombinase XerD